MAWPGPSVGSCGKAIVTGRPAADLVESGKMTRDLVLLISDKAPHLTTDEYLDAVDAELKKRMG